MRLKDGKTITIDGKDVQRIRILNDIVWEKVRETSLTLTISLNHGGNKITPNTSFNLQATLTDSNNQIINGNIVFSGNGIDGTKTIATKNGVAILEDIRTNNIGNNTYIAEFNGVSNLSPSQTSVVVNVQKETPEFSMEGIPRTIYYGWHFGIKLTKQDKTPLVGKKVDFIVNGQSYTHTVNSNGYATLANRLPDGRYIVTFTYDSEKEANRDGIYNTITESVEYIVKTGEYAILSYDHANLGYKGGELQSWIQNSNNSYQCGKTNVTCGATEDTIGAASQALRNPDVLKIFYKKGNIPNIINAELTFDSQSISPCQGSIGGYFEGVPDIKISLNNSYYETPTEGYENARQFNVSTSNGNVYSSYDIITQTIKWDWKECANGCKPVPQNVSTPVIAINYPENKGINEGCIKITNLYLKIKYIPTETIQW